MNEASFTNLKEIQINNWKMFYNNINMIIISLKKQINYIKFQNYNNTRKKQIKLSMIECYKCKKFSHKFSIEVDNVNHR